MIRISLFIAILLFCFTNGPGLFAAPLQKYENVRYIQNPANDGDSFEAELGKVTVILRLYYVDCPETSASGTGDASRLLEQLQYWGITNPASLVNFGRVASDFTQNILSKPFTVYTSHANALGRSSKGRIYAFVVTEDGKDLASLLVEAGLARVKGVGRTSPEGIRQEEVKARLFDLELAAALKRVGIWHETDPDQISELRNTARSQREELNRLVEQVSTKPTPPDSLDLNTASMEELVLIPGIGNELAKRIINARPFTSFEDLLNVDGIGKQRLKTIKEHSIINTDD
ncbi:MAG: hypothetical protein GX811_11665 [Lentisphaerae bacterium]|nr:hypothetical protein [Lentisphaerota bacterium]